MRDTRPRETRACEAARVEELLGRRPRGSWEVAVRDRHGDPVVIRTAPILDDGTPMPTLYWLLGSPARLAVDRLEAGGGVRDAEAAVDPDELASAHHRYAAERDRLLPSGWAGSAPSGGVGGARKGVKCLHAHYAWHLAGGDDPVGRWVSERLGGNVAAIDCGTNSTRLLVAGPNGEAIERLMRITRLGRGVDRDHVLSADSIERTLGALREFREVMDRHGVGRVRIAATSAARDARNREEFFGAAEQVTGARPELLGGDEEGRLSFVGATASLDVDFGPYLVADIGGGSTELAAGAGGGSDAQAVCSLDIGCVRVTERCFRHDPPFPSELNAARSEVGEALEKAEQTLPQLRGAKVLVGLAGTVSTLAAVDQGLPSYDRNLMHHHLLRRDRVEQMLSELAGVPTVERRRRPGVEHDRADVIVGGTVVLAVLMGQFGYEVCLTSESDILDGLVMSLTI